MPDLPDETICRPRALERSTRSAGAQLGPERDNAVLRSHLTVTGGDEHSGHITADLARRIAELEQANTEIRQSRRAALNLMEDAVQARETVESLNRALQREIEERKRAEALSECQREALQRLAAGVPLGEVLGFLIEIAERQADNGMLGSILLLNEAGTHFQQGIGPNLPPAFNAAVEGIAVSSRLSVCCHAIQRRESVAAPDLEADAVWSRFVAFAVPCGLHAGWSTPILGSDAQVLGTFANYYREPRDPTPRDLKWVEVVTRTAAIAIERARFTRERDQLLAAERAARTEAEKANRLKDDFLATISHELRTPLSTVVSWGRVLQKKYKGDDPQLKRGFSVIVDNALLQAQIVSDLLDMSRIVSGKIQLEILPADLGQIIENTVEGQRPAAEAKRIRLDVECPAEPVIIELDATRIQQVLWNLLVNAIKFTPESGHIAIEMRPAADFVEIHVRDSGVGISTVFLPHVFDRFRQAEGGITRRFGGLGLGLALVKQLIELHGGSVMVESAGEGCGATFTVRLLRRKSAAGGRSGPRGLSRAYVEEPEGPVLQGMRILAVEDDATMLELVTRMLTEYGASVRAVGSAAAALEAARGSERFDLLLTDIGLPEMDGFELLRRLRARHAVEALPAIAVTAFAREEDRERALASGFQAHVTKPYEVARLVGLIKSVRRPAQT